MKRILILSIVVLATLNFSGAYGQNVIMVDSGYNKISAAFEQAGPGDVIELITNGGTYYETDKVTATFPITIRAAAGLQNKPVWESGGDHVLDIGSSVWLSGIRMTGFVDDEIVDDRDSTKYAMRSADVVDSGYVLICEDMVFDHFGRFDDGVLQGYVYRADAPAVYASEIRFTNCTFTRIPSYGFRFREPSSPPGQFGVLSFENCTFAEIGDYGMRAALISDPGVPDAQIRVNHCTFYGVGNDVIRADDDGANDFTDIVVKNSIFNQTGQIVDASHGTVTYCAELNTNGFNIDDPEAVVENIYAEDPEFLYP
ncbi:MAG: right-handed parallel beta-helix repeat-containing protein [Gemmatimonadota bacterium]|nr:MAG: right-handed parallel beta-helix repeat-containing protein [Gemmatimonadota bacterium]